MNKQIEQATKKAARQDLKIAKTQGMVCVTGTKQGNIQIKVVHGVLFRFENFNTGELLNWNSGAKTMKEAVELLASLYIVEVA